MSQSQGCKREEDIEVTCVTCGERVYEGRIYQCSQDHGSCEVCKVRQRPCGHCSEPLTDRRNCDLEKLLMECSLRCPNVPCCWLDTNMAAMETHIKNCLLRPQPCPSLGPGCTWIGQPSQLCDHFNNMHPLHTRGAIGKEMFLTITETSHTMHFIQLQTYNFLFHIKVSEADAKIYIAVQTIGTTAKGATKWRYGICIYNSESKTEFQCTNVCSSVCEPLEDIISNNKCVVIQQEYAKTFICRGRLAYKFYVERNITEYEVIRCAGTVYRGGMPPQTKIRNKIVRKNLNGNLKDTGAHALGGSSRGYKI